MGFSVRTLGNALTVGENMARKITSTSERCHANFFGTKQVVGGKTVVQGELARWDYTRPLKYTSVTKPLENGYQQVSRTYIPDYMQFADDTTRIVRETSESFQGKTLKTRTVDEYIYRNSYTDVLGIYNTKIESLFSGKKLVGSKITKSTDGRRLQYVTYKDAQGNVLKEVTRDKQTGKRVSAQLPDGRVTQYDERGLVTPTNYNGQKMDLGGLDMV